MSNVALRMRPGLGPGVDPHLDAMVGRIAAMPASKRDPAKPHLESGYIEFDDGSPWEQLIALLQALYGVPPTPSGLLDRLGIALGLRVPAQLWAHVATLHYLTTDAATGIALPVFDINPGGTSGTSLDEAVARLDQLSALALRTAPVIGLTVSFRLDHLADALAAAQPPQPGLPAQPLPPAQLMRSGAELRHRLRGGTHPRYGALGRRLFGVQRAAARVFGTSGMAAPQLQRAAQELRSGSPEPVAAGGYGLDESGTGVLVGIVDFGCDFAHPLFRRGGDPARSRVLVLWDQNDPTDTTAPGGFGYGRTFTREQIDCALAAWQNSVPNDPHEPYRLLGYDPHDNHYTAQRPGTPTGPAAAHGLQVMQIAAGGARAGCAAADAATPPVQGVAPGADIAFVQVRQRNHLGQRILDLNDVLDAVAFVFQVADKAGMPCVVNLSLNTMSGPHDGDGYFERRLAALLRDPAGPAQPGRAVVVAAGNVDPTHRRWQHLRDEVRVGASSDPVAASFEFEWRVEATDVTRNSVEIWYDATDAWLQVSLKDAAGQSLGRVSAGEAAEIFVDGEPCGSIIGSRPLPAAGAGAAPPGGAAGDDLAPGRHVILLEVDPRATGGASWKVMLEATGRPGGVTRSGASVPFDAWLERDDEGQSSICRSGALPVTERDRQGTLGTLSCSREAIVVGAYTTRAAGVDQVGFTARGPGRRARLEKPDLSAPGHEVHLVNAERDIAAGASPCAAASGTSIAAPFVTGTIACLYEIWREAPLAAVREALRAAARPSPLAGGASWDPVFGCGRLDPAATLARLKAAKLAASAPVHT